MPQTFQVLRCHKCLIFQVHQTKKANKFQCKICGEKQSIKRHYGLANGQECRLHVQELNGIRSNFDEVIQESDSEFEVEIPEEDHHHQINVKDLKLHQHPKRNRNSKWSTYVEHDQTKEVDISNETLYLGNSEVVLELPNYKKIGKSKTKRNIDTSIVSKDINKAEASTYVDSQSQYASNTNLSVYSNECKKISKCISIEKANHNETDVGTNKILREYNEIVKTLTPKYSEKIDDHADVCNFLTTKEVANIHYVKTREKENEIHKAIPRNVFSLCEDDNLDSVLEL